MERLLLRWGLPACSLVRRAQLVFPWLFTCAWMRAVLTPSCLDAFACELCSWLRHPAGRRAKSRSGPPDHGADQRRAHGQLVAHRRQPGVPPRGKQPRAGCPLSLALPFAVLARPLLHALCCAFRPRMPCFSCNCASSCPFGLARVRVGFQVIYVALKRIETLELQLSEQMT